MSFVTSSLAARGTVADEDQGIEGDCLAQTALFLALAELISTYGEDATARYAAGLAPRISNGEFSVELSRQ
jgi:hypothetical protein